MSGRTSWWPCDAAEHDRELSVELGETFGPVGPLVMRVMKDLAQQQRDENGVVVSGFRVLRTKCFTTTEEARLVVEKAAEIGALDDLQIDDDGRRFTCRVSGWKADQSRGRQAIRRAQARRDDPQEPITGWDKETPEETPPAAVSPDTQSDPLVTPEETTPPVVSPQQPVSCSRPLHNQRRTETPPTPPAGGNNRRRDRDAYETELLAWAAEYFPDSDPAYVAAFVPVARGWLRTDLVTAASMRDVALKAASDGHPIWAQHLGLVSDTLADEPTDEEIDGPAASPVNAERAAMLSDLGQRATELNQRAEAAA